MQVLTPTTVRDINHLDELTIPMYACRACGEPVMVKNVTITEAKAWKDGELIQNVWPTMTPDERECLILRHCPECCEEVWDFIDRMEAADEEFGG